MDVLREGEYSDPVYGGKIPRKGRIRMLLLWLSWHLVIDWSTGLDRRASPGDSIVALISL